MKICNHEIVHEDYLTASYSFCKHCNKEYTQEMEKEIEALKKPRSQRLREAGFTRRPTWRSLPKDGDAESDKETGDSNE